MIFKSFLYGIYTVIAAFVESIRIKLGWGKVKNLNHIISALVGILGYVIIIYIFKMDNVLDLAFFTINCGLIRGILYDPLLNVFRNMKIDHESKSTNSKTDYLERILKLGFWKQRRLYLYSFLTSIVLYSILKFI